MADTPLPPIAMFWTGAPVDWMQRLSVHSFVQHGYKVTLFSPKDGVDPYFTPETLVIHLFNDQIRKWNKSRTPPEGCFLDQYIKQSGFKI